jgi:hypothetical protein
MMMTMMLPPPMMMTQMTMVESELTEGLLMSMSMMAWMMTI